MSDFTSNFIASFVSGGCAGCAVDLALFPIDTVKTSLQAKKPIRWLKIYNGLTWTMTASFPCAATFWSSYLSMKWLLSSLEGFENPTLVHFLAASFGSLCTSLVRNPFEVIKQQLQIGMHSSSYKAPATIMKSQGILGFYAGILSLIYREIPFDTMQMILYEFLKGKDYGGGDVPMYKNLVNGAIAGGVAAFITTPIDVAKTRLMTDGGKGVYKSFLQTMWLLWREGGTRALWTGWHVRVLFTTVGGMMFFGTFEGMKDLISS